MRYLLIDRIERLEIGRFLIAIKNVSLSEDVFSYHFVGSPVTPGALLIESMAQACTAKLEHLRPVDKSYRIVLRNEVDETQHLDEMKLLIVDEDPDRSILPDYFGNFYAVEAMPVPIRAVDENGLDLKKFVESSDGVAWQSLLPTGESGINETLRHDLTFEFSKPSGAAPAVLVVNFGTAAWGSNMIREMLQLRGDKIDEWYEGIRTGGEAYRELAAFAEREQLYLLKFFIREGDTWRFHGWIQGGGPFITEDVVIPVDLSGVVGETVAVRVSPPRGFWTIDHMALGTVAGLPGDPLEVALRSAVDQDGRDIRNLFSEADHEEYVMPRIGDMATLEFPAPPQRKGATRSIFLKTRGFYEIHIDKTRPEQTALIEAGFRSEGKVVEYSLDEFRKLYRQRVGENAGSDSVD